MSTKIIQNLMEYWSHCQECGAQLVTVAGGAICPHCGFELEEPEENEVLSFRKARAAWRVGEEEFFWSSDHWAGECYDEVA